MLKNILKYSIMLLAAVFMTACVEETPVPYFGIEGDHVSYSVNFEEVTKADAQVFTVRSNQSWELVGVEEYDWLKPFPAKGEGDGQFRFIINANNTVEERQAVFKLLVDGETQSTVFTVTQGPRGEFVKAYEKSFSLGFSETVLKLNVERNVEIQLTTVSDDSGANGSWVTLAANQPQAEDSLYIKVAESDQLQPRTAEIAISMKGDPTIADTLTIFQAGTQELYGLPAIWRFKGRQDEAAYKTSWEEKNSVPADEGLGTFSFITPDPIVDPSNKHGRVVGGTGDPYVTGAWPGDYWLYEIPAVVPANTLFSINFAGRVSGTGHKFWMLEYLDGEEWKPVGAVLTTEETGATVEYTNAMQNANAQIGGSFKVKNAMNSLKIRYRCMANWQSSGAGALAARNGGTARMSGDDDAFLKIEVLATNVGDAADVTMSAKHVALEGAEGSEGSFTFTSTESWILTSTADWIEFTPTSGAANEEATVTVKALSANATGALRKADLVLNAGMTKINVEVVQGAAGSLLSPFISIVGGNTFKATFEEKSYDFEVQANVDYEVVTDVDWITVVPATKALVEVHPLTLSLKKNDGDAKRTGKVTVFNKTENVESVLTIVQGVFTPLHVEWLFTEEASLDATNGYAEDWGTTSGRKFKTAGDNGQFVNANVTGTGKLTFVQIDKTLIDTDNKAEWKTGGTGHPFVYGAWPGDYWLFEATDGYTYPAGTNVNISYITRVSTHGQKYWRVEYLDGTEWKAAMPTSKATVNGEVIDYNIEMLQGGKKNTAVNTTVTLSVPTKNIKFRMLCLANIQVSDGTSPAAPTGATSRIAGDETGTSPVIKVIE